MDKQDTKPTDDKLEAQVEAAANEDSRTETERKLDERKSKRIPRL